MMSNINKHIHTLQDNATSDWLIQNNAKKTVSKSDNIKNGE
jgi:hypothetical protein